MYSKVRGRFVAIGSIAVAACGSTSDLVIGSQIEAGLAVRDGSPADGSGIQDGGHISVCAEASVRPTDGGNAGAIVADAGCSDPSLCTGLKTALVHRYSFKGTGTFVEDSIGGAHGTVVNTQLAGDGTLVLEGSASDQYVDLPNGIIGSLANATFETWVNWGGCGGWERIFDFGDAGQGENVRGYASTTLYLTPISVNGGDVMFGGFKRADQDSSQETRAASGQPLVAGAIVQVALVVDDANNAMSLYRDGALEGSVMFNDSLSMLNDVNNWLGRSQYAADPSFGGTLYEFRIYNVALSASSIQASFAGGPDPAYLE